LLKVDFLAIFPPFRWGQAFLKDGACPPLIMQDRGGLLHLYLGPLYPIPGGGVMSRIQFLISGELISALFKLSGSGLRYYIIRFNKILYH